MRFKRSQPNSEPGSKMLIADRPIPGIPNVFTGRTSTYAEHREMASDVAKNTWQTPVEKGLAISIVAIIDDFDHEMRDRATTQ
jgi:hypothetical protein